ncbi:hypothetical protein [Dickeya zeae]|uniref:hypothetical protein n=1 Tax=Dickeya zeae TaxID=204042 RepID=UPI001F3293A5|nr:hypothetical protein [Dickeya zeae]
MIDIDFSIKGGNVIFDDFPIKDGEPLRVYIDDLKEDMLQVEFPKGYILDVGWRPSFEINGKFYAVLIKDYDWGNPIYSESARDLKELKTKFKKNWGEYKKARGDLKILPACSYLTICIIKAALLFVQCEGLWRLSDDTEYWLTRVANAFHEKNNGNKNINRY